MIPRIQVALNGWESTITLIKISQAIVDFQTVNSKSALIFKGVVQPLSPKQLVIKPISERSWEWLMIHTKTRLAVSTNDLIKYKDKKYKIMLQNDYSLNGYYEYHLVKNYE